MQIAARLGIDTRQRIILARISWLVVLVASTFLAIKDPFYPIILVVGVAIVMVSPGRVFDWNNMLLATLTIIMLVPARLYKLPSYLPFNLEPYRFIMIGMFSIWLFSLIATDRVRLNRSRIDKPLIAFFLITVVSYILNFSGFEQIFEIPLATRALFTIVSCGLLYFYITSTTFKREDIYKAIKLLVVLAAILSLFAIVEKQTKYNFFKHLSDYFPLLIPTSDEGLALQLMRGGLRVSGSSNHPIAFGTILGMCLPFSYYFLKTSAKTYQKILYSFSAVLIVIGAMTTISRTSFFALVIAATVLYIGAPKDRMRIAAFAACAMILVHLAIPGALHQIKSHLTPSYIQTQEIGNQNGRVEDYPIVIGEFLKLPLLGRGFGTFDPVKYIYLDNQYLGVIVELGIAGLLAFITIFVMMIRELKRATKSAEENDRTLLVVFMASLSIFAVSSATFDTLGFSQPTYLFFLILGLAFAFISIMEGNLSKPSVSISTGVADRLLQ